MCVEGFFGCCFGGGVLNDCSDVAWGGGELFGFVVALVLGGLFAALDTFFDGDMELKMVFREGERDNGFSDGLVLLSPSLNSMLHLPSSSGRPFILSVADIVGSLWRSLDLLETKKSRMIVPTRLLLACLPAHPLKAPWDPPVPRWGATHPSIHTASVLHLCPSIGMSDGLQRGSGHCLSNLSWLGAKLGGRSRASFIGGRESS